jgi:hypothetical protein
MVVAAEMQSIPAAVEEAITLPGGMAAASRSMTAVQLI